MGFYGTWQNVFLLSLVCSVRTISCGSSHGPQTRLIRGINTAVVMIEKHFVEQFTCTTKCCPRQSKFLRFSWGSMAYVLVVHCPLSWYKAEQAGSNVTNHKEIWIFGHFVSFDQEIKILFHF